MLIYSNLLGIKNSPMTQIYAISLIALYAYWTWTHMSVLSFRPPPPEFLIECEVRRRIQIKTSWNLILMQALATGIFDEWNERKDKSP